MNLGQILANAYRRVGLRDDPGFRYSQLFTAAINRWHERVMSHSWAKRYERIRIELQTVSEQAEYGLRVTTFEAVRDVDDRRILEPRTPDWYWSRVPDPSQFTGSPLYWVDLGDYPIERRPTEHATVRLVSTAAADTQTVAAVLVAEDGGATRTSVDLTGTTPVELGEASDITNLSLSTPAAGAITVQQVTSGDPITLGVIRPGESRPRYQRLALAPTPGGGERIVIEATTQITRMQEVSDEPLFPERFHSLLEDAAVHAYYQSINRIEEAAQLEKEIFRLMRQLKNRAWGQGEETQERLRLFPVDALQAGRYFVGGGSGDTGTPAPSPMQPGNGGTLTGDQIVALLVALQGDDRLPASAVRDLPAGGPGGTDGVITGGSVVGQNLVVTRSVGSSVTIDLSDFATGAELTSAVNDAIGMIPSVSSFLQQSDIIAGDGIDTTAGSGNSVTVALADDAVGADEIDASDRFAIRDALEVTKVQDNAGTFARTVEVDGDGLSLAPVSGGRRILNIDNPFTSADETKLDGIEDAATADQTGAEIAAAIDDAIGTAWRSAPGGGPGTADGVVSAANVSGTNLILTRTVGAAITVDLSAFEDSPDGVVTGGSIAGGTNLILTRSVGSSLTIDLSDALDIADSSIRAVKLDTSTSARRAEFRSGIRATEVWDGSAFVSTLNPTGSGLSLAAESGGQRILSVANPFTAADETKLDGVETGATADQTGPEIVTALEALQGNSRLQASAIRNLPSGGGTVDISGKADVDLQNIDSDLSEDEKETIRERIGAASGETVFDPVDVSFTDSISFEHLASSGITIITEIPDDISVPVSLRKYLRIGEVRARVSISWNSAQDVVTGIGIAIGGVVHEIDTTDQSGNATFNLNRLRPHREGDLTVLGTTVTTTGQALDPLDGSTLNAFASMRVTGAFIGSVTISSVELEALEDPGTDVEVLVDGNLVPATVLRAGSGIEATLDTDTGVATFSATAAPSPGNGNGNGNGNGGGGELEFTIIGDWRNVSFETGAPILRRPTQSGAPANPFVSQAQLETYDAIEIGVRVGDFNGFYQVNRELLQSFSVATNSFASSVNNLALIFASNTQALFVGMFAVSSSTGDLLVSLGPSGGTGGIRQNPDGATPQLRVRGISGVLAGGGNGNGNGNGEADGVLESASLAAGIATFSLTEGGPVTLDLNSFSTDAERNAAIAGVTGMIPSNNEIDGRADARVAAGASRVQDSDGAFLRTVRLSDDFTVQTSGGVSTVTPPAGGGDNGNGNGGGMGTPLLDWTLSANNVVATRINTGLINLPLLVFASRVEHNEGAGLTFSAGSSSLAQTEAATYHIEFRANVTTVGAGRRNPRIQVSTDGGTTWGQDMGMQYQRPGSGTSGIGNPLTAGGKIRCAASGNLQFRISLQDHDGRAATWSHTFSNVTLHITRLATMEGAGGSASEGGAAGAAGPTAVVPGLEIVPGSSFEEDEDITFAQAAVTVPLFDAVAVPAGALFFVLRVQAATTAPAASTTIRMRPYEGDDGINVEAGTLNIGPSIDQTFTYAVRDNDGSAVPAFTYDDSGTLRLRMGMVLTSGAGNTMLTDVTVSGHFERRELPHAYPFEPIFTDERQVDFATDDELLIDLPGGPVNRDEHLEVVLRISIANRGHVHPVFKIGMSDFKTLANSFSWDQESITVLSFSGTFLDLWKQGNYYQNVSVAGLGADLVLGMNLVRERDDDPTRASRLALWVIHSTGQVPAINAFNKVERVITAVNLA